MASKRLSDSGFLEGSAKSRKPLKIDTATHAGSRPSMACVLVELDITKSCIGHVVGNCRDKFLSAPSKALNVMPGSHLESSPVAPVLAAGVIDCKDDDNLRDTIDPVVSDVAELEPMALDPNGCCVGLEGIPSVLPVSDDVSLGLETSGVHLVPPITRNPSVPNVLARPSYVEVVKAASLVLDNVVPGDVHSDVVRCAVVPFVSFGGGGDTPILDKSPINLPVTAPAALVSEVISKAISIPIAVMSDDELRA
ncbi:hypothetical protein M5K25_004750 [Dendrobium thyrsiflorum]|uniref:Uncharacterized protein n=1 Tax=Dendrobium thyrsiflorum TaxID=117978 RepID=A0ABD0VMV0_DENTH